MMLLVRWLILTASIMIASYLIDGIRVNSFLSAFCAAAILGILNCFFKPILILLTLPLNILTLGIFTLVINAFLLKLTTGVIPGFEIQGFWPAVLGALVISIVSGLLFLIIPDRGQRWD